MIEGLGVTGVGVTTRRGAALIFLFAHFACGEVGRDITLNMNIGGVIKESID